MLTMICTLHALLYTLQPARAFLHMALIDRDEKIHEPADWPHVEGDSRSRNMDKVELTVAALTGAARVSKRFLYT
jgi:hypothetical protein